MDCVIHWSKVNLLNTARAQKELINKLPRNTFGAVTRIRPIIIITFGTTNVAHNSITFETGVGVGSRDRDIVTIFTNPSAQAGYDTRSIFKRSLTGLNSEFSFS